MHNYISVQFDLYIFGQQTADGHTFTQNLLYKQYTAVRHDIQLLYALMNGDQNVLFNTFTVHLTKLLECQTA